MSDRFKGRREDRRLITGQGRYTADHDVDGQAAAHFLRSDRAHATIRRIVTDAARKLPGVLAILTGDDLVAAGWQGLPATDFFKGVGGSTLRVPFRTGLAHRRVRFVGEPVALIVAETEAAARDAAEAVEIDFSDLPAVVEARDALADGAARLHEDLTDNLAFDYEYGDWASTEPGFAAAAHVVRTTLRAQRIAGAPMEPKSCLASYDAASDSYELCAPCQGASGLTSVLAAITSLPPERFRITAIDVGGAFGVREEVYPEFVALMLAARQTGRAVKWTGTRSESISGDHHGRGADLAGELALDRDGRFLAVRVQWLLNMGAYCSHAGALVNTIAAPTSTAINIYDVPAVHGRHRLVFTNTTPTTAYRGAGRPNVTYLWERLVEEAAIATGIDPVALRRRNLLRRDAFPVKTPTGSVYDSADPERLLRTVLAAADWNGFAARRKAAARAGRLRGIGLAMFMAPSGGPGREQIELRVGSDGVLSMFTLAGPSGQGHETVYPALVADILGIPETEITLRYNDFVSPKLTGVGTFASRGLISHGAALVGGARELVEKGRTLAAKHMEVAPGDVAFGQGRYRVAGTDLSVGLAELMRRPSIEGSSPLDTNLTIDVATAFPSGAHVAEVEVDPDTGASRIVSYVAADDCGTVYNTTLVEGQLHGGLMQGIGQVFGEHVAYDPETGQLLSGSFMDYVMPRAHDLGAVTLIDCGVPSPANPLGAKGAGEAGATGAVPALANAVLDALKARGVRHLEMPYTAERVWRAIHRP